jgi:hypothetical protein
MFAAEEEVMTTRISDGGELFQRRQKEGRRRWVFLVLGALECVRAEAKGKDQGSCPDFIRAEKGNGKRGSGGGRRTCH